MKFRHEAFKELRTEKGLTIDEFGAAVGMSKQVISTWETGASEPRIESLVKVAQAFGVPLDFFFSDIKTTVVVKDAAA